MGGTPCWKSTNPRVAPRRRRGSGYLEPGLSLRISDLTDTLGGYASNVVEIDEHTIWIDLPIRRDGMLNLSTGQLVSVRFDRPDDAVYLFDSVVSSVRDDDRAPFGVAMPVTINRRQHRSDARLALVLDATFQVPGDSPQSGKVVDLSAGGLGLICEHELALASDLTITCTLPGPDDQLAIEERTRRAVSVDLRPHTGWRHPVPVRPEVRRPDARAARAGPVVGHLEPHPKPHRPLSPTPPDPAGELPGEPAAGSPADLPEAHEPPEPLGFEPDDLWRVPNRWAMAAILVVVLAVAVIVGLGVGATR